MIFASFPLKCDINADLWIHIWDHKHKKEIIQDFYIALSRAYTFCFSKTDFSILTHSFSKTHPPQFLNNNNVCIPKYNYHSILLPLHLSIYFVWCSCRTTLFLLLIKKCAHTCIFIRECAYTCIFIQKLALYIHLYFHAYYFLNNTFRPADTNTLKI